MDNKQYDNDNTTCLQNYVKFRKTKKKTPRPLIYHIIHIPILFIMLIAQVIFEFCKNFQIKFSLYIQIVEEKKDERVG